MTHAQVGCFRVFTRSTPSSMHGANANPLGDCCSGWCIAWFLRFLLGWDSGGNAENTGCFALVTCTLDRVSVLHT